MIQHLHPGLFLLSTKSCTTGGWQRRIVTGQTRPSIHTNPPNSHFTPPPHPPSHMLHNTGFTAHIENERVNCKAQATACPVLPWQHAYRLKCGTKTQSNKSAQHCRFVLVEDCLDIRIHTCTHMLTHIQTLMCAQANTYTHTHARTHAHTHVQTHYCVTVQLQPSAEASLQMHCFQEGNHHLTKQYNGAWGMTATSRPHHCLV